MKEKRNTVIHEYVFARTGRFQSSERSLTEEEDRILDEKMQSEGWADTEKFLRLGRYFEPKIKKILLAELVRGKGKWRPTSPKFDLEHQHFDPEDADAIKDARDFRTDEFRKWLQPARSFNKSGKSAKRHDVF